MEVRVYILFIIPYRFIGVKHEIVNVGDEPFKIVWAYAPPLPAHLK
jgi:hypothetical protein